MVADINVVDLLPKVKAPTLVLHCRDDVRIPFSLGQEIASQIPGARFVPLEGRNHIILANDPAHRSFLKLAHKTYRDCGGNRRRGPFRGGGVANPAPLIACL